MSATVVLASSNPGKLREIAQLLSGAHLTVIPQSSYDVPEVPETGLTFVENAIPIEYESTNGLEALR